MLLRLDERTIGRGQLTVADPHGRGGLNGLEGLPADVVAALPEPLAEREILAHEGLRLALGHGTLLLLLIVDQAQILHSSLLINCRRMAFTLDSRSAEPKIDNKDPPMVESRLKCRKLGSLLPCRTRADRIHIRAHLREPLEAEARLLENVKRRAIGALD